MPTRIRCHVIEVPVQDDWLARRGGGGPRELLPWADPYIATLMRKLEGRASSDDFEANNPFEEVEASSGSIVDDGWEEDAFMPQPLEAPRFHSYPPVHGGFPLLEDE